MTDEVRRQIVLIEDDAVLSKMLTLHLEGAGFEVHAETTGVAGVGWVSAHRPDLVILDLRLPDISGYEVCKDIRKLYGRWDVPVLMLTAMDKPCDQLRGFAHGAEAYLTKPCSATELLGTVALLLGRTVPE